MSKYSKPDRQNVTSLSLKKFEHLVTAYGANPTRWPSDRRAAALDFLRQSAEAKAILGRESQLDQLLDLASPIDSKALQDKINAQIPNIRQMPYLGLFDRANMITATTLMAACLLAGVFSVPYLPISQWPFAELANLSADYAMLDFNLWNIWH